MIKEKIEKFDKIVVTAHQSPDGDAVGSSLALVHYLKAIGKDAVVILPDAIPPFIGWLDGVADILYFEKDAALCTQKMNEADGLFILDYNDLKRVGDKMAKVIRETSAFKMMIDHHLQPTDCADWMLSDTTSCSTAQLIYEFIEDLGDLDLINNSISEGIYTGLVTDSGSFRFPSVNAKTHLIVADLLKKGLNHSKIHESLFDVNSLDKLHLLGYSLNEKLKVLPNIPVAVIYLSSAEQLMLKNKKGYTEGLVNFALSVEGVEMAVFLREDDKKVKMSFRSKGDIPVNEFSGKYFSGGGHKNAAGGVCFDGYEKSIEKLETVLYEFFETL